MSNDIQFEKPPPQNQYTVKPNILGEKLTIRQSQIVKILAWELKQIADILKISEKTVQKHVYELYRKFGAHSKLGLILILSRKGLININNLELPYDPSNKPS